MGIFFVLLSIVGVINGFFIAVYILLVLRKKNPPDLFLALLVLFLTIRMAKSILFSISNPPFLIIHIGLSAFTCIGPLLLIYLIKSTNRKIKGTTIAIHFIPAMVVLASSLSTLSQNHHIWDLRYDLIMFQIFLYLAASWIFYFKIIITSKILPYANTWYLFIIILISIIWLSYGATWWLNVLPYLSSTFLFFFMVYILFYLLLKKKEIIESVEKYKNSLLTKEMSKNYYGKLMALMNEQKLYLDSKLTLAKLSDALGIQSYYLSQVINENMGMNFFDFINGFRIAEAKKRLLSDQYKHLTIAAIAYDCGFNSISSFNTAFKKVEHISPSQYKNNLKRYSTL